MFSIIRQRCLIHCKKERTYILLTFFFLKRESTWTHSCHLTWCNPRYRKWFCVLYTEYIIPFSFLTVKDIWWSHVESSECCVTVSIFGFFGTRQPQLSLFQITTFLINRVLFRVLIVLGRYGELCVLDDGLVNCGIWFSFISWADLQILSLAIREAFCKHQNPNWGGT